MMPDVSKETKQGWLFLAGTVAVCVIAFFIISDGGALIEQAQALQEKIKAGGDDDMRQHVQRQVEANQNLRKTIEQIKNDTKFEVAKYFQIPDKEPQPGYLFKRKFIEVREKLRNKAAARRVEYDQNLGFGEDPKVPDDRDAPYLLAMLQITEKVVTIALDTEAPLETFAVKQHPAVDTGPESRPILLREYPITLTVRGGLKDILSILHRISLVAKTEAGAASDYPLILRGLAIESKNATPRDDISQLDAVFELAAMRYMSEEERAKDPLAFQFSSGTASSSGGRGQVFYARP
jgi:Tfp pilus assembly protein PilP